MPKTKTKPADEELAIIEAPDDAILAFRIDIDTLAQALELAGRAIPSRPSHMILANFLIQADESVDPGKIMIRAFDLAIQIEVYVDAIVQKYGATTVPAKLLSDIVKRLDPGLLQVTVSPDHLVVLRSDTGRYEVKGMPDFDYPEPQTLDDGTTLELPLDDFRKRLSIVLPAASTEETKQVLTGVNFSADSTLKDLVLATTDGHRLHVASVTIPGEGWEVEQSRTIPAKALTELTKVLNKSKAETLTIRYGNALVEFACDDVEISARMMEGDFPNYRQLIPRTFAVNWTCDRQSLLSSLERLQIFADQKGNIIKFEVTADQVTLSSDVADVGSGKESLPCESTGDLVIAFNIKYVIEALKVLPATRSTFYANSPTSPVIIKPLGLEDPLMLIMPVQVRGT